MRKAIALLPVIAALAALFTLATVSAQAMPAAPLKGFTKSVDTVTPIRGGCGPLRHRGPHGHCRPGP